MIIFYIIMAVVGILAVVVLAHGLAAATAFINNYMPEKIRKRVNMYVMGFETPEEYWENEALLEEEEKKK